MANQGFRPEQFPLVVQVLTQNGKDYLSVYQPDFDYRVIEIYRPQDIGQTEMLIIKVRREILSKSKEPSHLNTSPTLSSALFKIPESKLLSSKGMARKLGVSEQTVRRMADTGKLDFQLTPGGHRRFSEEEVKNLSLRMSPLVSHNPIIEYDHSEHHRTPPIAISRNSI
jgi:excisionase family DNA binding protein